MENISSLNYPKKFLTTILILWISLLIYSQKFAEVHLQFGDNIIEMSWLRFGINISLFLILMTSIYYFLREYSVSNKMFQFHLILTIGAIIFFFVYKYIWMDEPRFTPPDIKADYTSYLTSKAKYANWENLYFLFLFVSVLSFTTNTMLSLVKFFSKSLWKEPLI